MQAHVTKREYGNSWPLERDIRAALHRIVASTALAKSHQLAHFLTFIVDETLAGRGERLKAYTIATDGLGRDADFDPQTDPIVRVEAARLRHALEQYYATEGRDDPLVIELPLGRYVPVFRANRPPILRGLTGMRQRATEAWRGHRGLLLTIVVVAVVVSLTVDTIETLVAHAIWPDYNEQVAAPSRSMPTSGRDGNP